MSKFKRALSAFLAIAIVFGMFSCLAPIVAPVASAVEGTSKIDSYADLAAKYGQNGDGFVYAGLEFYEADGKLTDYYVNAGDELTARLYIKGNLRMAESYFVSLYDKTFFDVKLAGGPNAATDGNGYTSNYGSGTINASHPVKTNNNAGHTITSIPASNVNILKQAGLTTDYLASHDLIKSNTKTDTTAALGTQPYDITSDEWLFEFYVKVQPGLADGTKGLVESPASIWHAGINSKTGLHDARMPGYINVVDPSKTVITESTTMAAAMDSGLIDTFVSEDLEHEFTIGANPNAGGDTPSGGGSVEGVSKIDSYADLAAKYGQNGDGFVYAGLEFYEADGKLTDYYVNAGDELTARLYIKGNLRMAESYFVSLYDKTFFDVKLAGGPNAATDGNGYTSNYGSGTINASHPVKTNNNAGHTITSIPASNVNILKQAGLTTDYLASHDLIKSNTKTDTTAALGTQPYDITSDEWLFEFYVKVQPGLADGTKGLVESPASIWHAGINSKTGLHDARMPGYINVVDPSKTVITESTTMAAAMDSGLIDTFVSEDLEHEFTIGANPNAGGDTPSGGGSVEGVSKIDSYADLAAKYGQNGDGFVYAGLEFYEADGKLTDYYVNAGDELTARLYIKGNLRMAESYFVSLYDKTFFDVKLAGGPNAATDGNGYTSNYGSGTINASHPVKTNNNAGHTITSIPASNVNILKQAGLTTDYLASHDLIKSNTKTDTTATLGTQPYDITSDEWLFEFYVKVQPGLADGTKGLVESPASIWHAGINSKTGLHDARMPGYINVVDPSKTLITESTTMAAAMDSGLIDTFVSEDLEHEFTIGKAPAGGTYAATFKVDGQTVSTANYATGAAIAAPEAPSKDGYVFLGWALEGTTQTLTFPQTMGNAAVTYVAIFQEVVKYTATFYVDGAVYGEVKSYAQGEAIVAPADPTKAGYTFTGWNPSVGNMGSANATFNATFAAKSYNVSFYKEMDDDTAYQTLTVKYDAAYNLPAAPTKLGYTFVKWVDANNADMPATHKIEGDAAFYAVWAAGTFNATFKANGGQFADGTDTAIVPTVFGQAIVAPAAPTKVGNEFLGWTPEVGNMTAEGMTFTAQWQAAQIGVHFMDGETELALLTGSFGSDIAAMSPNPSKDGFTFKGWQYADGTTADFPITLGAEAVYVYAVWEAKSYYIEFYAPTDSDWLDGSNQLCGQPIVAPAAPTKSGYTFVGWVDADGNPMPETVPAIENQVYYGRYEATLYDAIFYVDGEEYHKFSGAYQASITAPDAPEKEGYTFNYWTKQGSTSKVNFPQRMPVGGVNYNAKFTVNKYTITYYVDGVKVNSATYEYGAAVTPYNYTPAEGASFSGWGNQVPATMPANNVDVYGTTGVASYKVTFTIDGVEFTSFDVAYGAAITAPEAPAKEGYTFSGWDVPATMPAQNITLDATYTINKYTVRFWLDDAMSNLYYEVELEYGATIEYPVDPEVPGKEFVDWDITPETVPASDIDIIASFNDIFYNVEFVGEDGSIVADGEYLYGNVIDEAPVAPVKEGYDFIGWFVDGVQASFPYTITEEVTFEAVYDVQSLKVIYYVDDVQYGFDPYDFGAAIALRDELVKEGYTFSGWQDADGNAIELPATMPAEDIEVYGYFTVNQYPVTFNAGDGAFADGSKEITIDVDFGTVPTAPETPALAGYGFAGWTPALAPVAVGGATYTAKYSAGMVNYTVETYTMGLDGQYGAPVSETKSGETDAEVSEAPVAAEGFTLDAQNSVLSGVVAADGSTVLKIYFIRNQYDLTISIDGADSTVTYYYGADVAAQDEPTKTGYTFIGWSEEIPATMPATDLTITALFQINQYTITFVDTGDKAYEAITQDYATAIADVADPVKTGYTFAGWDVEIPATMPAEDLTITASWTINQYTITFVTDGGTEIAPITQDYATAVTAPADPEKEGHTFKGWDAAIPATMPAEDLTINAIWEVNYYDAKFIIDGQETIISTAFGTVPTAPVPTKVGYTFTGWAEGEVVAMVVGGATYTAVFEANTYEAIFDAAGGAWADGDTQKVVPTVFDTAIDTTTVGLTKDDAAAPTREAYIFAGWTPVVGNMTTEGITFVAQWTNDTSFCRVQDVKLVAPAELTSITKAAYEIKVMGAPVKVQIAGGEDYSFTWTFDRLDTRVAGDLTKSGLVDIKRYNAAGEEIAAEGIKVEDGTYEVWKVVVMLSEDSYKVRAKVGYTTADWEEITTAYDYTVEFKEITADADIIQSVTVAKNVIKRGTYETITVVTDASVSRIRLAMNKADGSTLIVSYSPAAEDSCAVTDNGDGTETWALKMRFTYTGTAEEEDQKWVVWYRTEGSSSWLESAEDYAEVKVVKYEQTSSANPEYAAFSIISVTGPTDAVVGKYVDVVVKTTADVTKVRLGFNGKTSTYLTTSRNLVYEVNEAEGTATWTISYRFTTEGEQTWTAQCRGNKWSEATAFTFTAAAK